MGLLFYLSTLFTLVFLSIPSRKYLCRRYFGKNVNNEFIGSCISGKIHGRVQYFTPFPQFFDKTAVFRFVKKGGVNSILTAYLKPSAWPPCRIICSRRAPSCAWRHRWWHHCCRRCCWPVSLTGSPQASRSPLQQCCFTLAVWRWKHRR